VLYSDGVTEAFSPDGEEFGEKRLEEALAEMRGLSAREVLDGIQQRVEQFLGVAPATDDMTIVVVRRP
jgi:serine phosphatase RsbU (regulator of sigma subunit)